MAEAIALSAAGILFLSGLVGTILPVLPGPALIWAGMLVYGLIAGFENLGPGFLVIQALLVLCIFGLDYLFSALGTRYFGGSNGSGRGCGRASGRGFLFSLSALSSALSWERFWLSSSSGRKPPRPSGPDSGPPSDSGSPCRSNWAWRLS
jgi:hypothetical protein